eukprot:1147250-Pelagomonas_calceolata.AAC.3
MAEILHLVIWDSTILRITQFGEVGDRCYKQGRQRNPSLKAAHHGTPMQGLFEGACKKKGYTPDRQPDTGDHAASISTLERLYCPPQLANLREEWEAAKEDQLPNPRKENKLGCMRVALRHRLSPYTRPLSY